MSEIASRVKAIIVDKLGVEESEVDVYKRQIYNRANLCNIFQTSNPFLLFYFLPLWELNTDCI